MVFCLPLRQMELPVCCQWFINDLMLLVNLGHRRLKKSISPLENCRRCDKAFDFSVAERRMHQ